MSWEAAQILFNFLIFKGTAHNLPCICVIQGSARGSAKIYTQNLCFLLLWFSLFCNFALTFQWLLVALKFIFWAMGSRIFFKSFAHLTQQQLESTLNPQFIKFKKISFYHSIYINAKFLSETACLVCSPLPSRGWSLYFFKSLYLLFVGESVL